MPLARADHLLDSAAAVDAADVKEDPKTPELNALGQEDSPKSVVPVRWLWPALRGVKLNCNRRRRLRMAQHFQPWLLLLPQGGFLDS